MLLFGSEGTSKSESFSSSQKKSYSFPPPLARGDRDQQLVSSAQGCRKSLSYSESTVEPSVLSKGFAPCGGCSTVGAHTASGRLDSGLLACPTEAIKKEGVDRMSQL